MNRTYTEHRGPISHTQCGETKRDTKVLQRSVRHFIPLHPSQNRAESSVMTRDALRGGRLQRRARKRFSPLLGWWLPSIREGHLGTSWFLLTKWSVLWRRDSIWMCPFMIIHYNIHTTFVIFCMIFHTRKCKKPKRRNVFIRRGMAAMKENPC